MTSTRAETPSPSTIWSSADAPRCCAPEAVVNASESSNASTAIVRGRAAPGPGDDFWVLRTSRYMGGQADVVNGRAAVYVPKASTPLLPFLVWGLRRLAARLSGARLPPAAS